MKGQLIDVTAHLLLLAEDELEKGRLSGNLAPKVRYSFENKLEQLIFRENDDFEQTGKLKPME